MGKKIYITNQGGMFDVEIAEETPTECGQIVAEIDEYDLEEICTCLDEYEHEGDEWSPPTLLQILISEAFEKGAKWARKFPNEEIL